MNTPIYEAIIPLRNLALFKSNYTHFDLLDNFKISSYRYINEDDEEEIKDICISVKYLTEKKLKEYYTYDEEDYRKYVRILSYPQPSDSTILDELRILGHPQPSDNTILDKSHPYLIIRFSAEQTRTLEYTKLCNVIGIFFRALGLFKTEKVSFKSDIVHMTVEINDNHKEVVMSGGLIPYPPSHDIEREYIGGYELLHSEKDVFEEFYRRFFEFSNHHDVRLQKQRWDINMALRFLDRTLMTYTSNNKFTDRFIFLSIALEALFSKGKESSKKEKYSTRGANLLCDDPQERNWLYEKISTLYDLRSEIVHGNPKFMLHKYDLYALYEIVRCSILRFIVLYMNGFCDIIDKLDEIVSDEKVREEMKKYFYKEENEEKMKVDPSILENIIDKLDEMLSDEKVREEWEKRLKNCLKEERFRIDPSILGPNYSKIYPELFEWDKVDDNLNYKYSEFVEFLASMLYEDKKRPTLKVKKKEKKTIILSTDDNHEIKIALDDKRNGTLIIDDNNRKDKKIKNIFILRDNKICYFKGFKVINIQS
ncbi:MAG: hypothetical protein KatS3mg003_0468 [Candidatus Nitrosocaldaceae archaeon]|nr:MAG: hypothetical protein KatS3mg003_0468 [Candidatus Nitrosocaldaceae archaeon]